MSNTKRFNLSLDDYSPHPNAGLHHESIAWCERLIEKYGYVKINLFIPAAYCRLNENPRYLSQFQEWVDYVARLPEEHYRINLHGLFHRRIDGKNPDSNNDEFQFLKGTWTTNVITMMINEFDKVGLKYHKTFRPPGWKISHEAAQELTDKGFIIAGDDKYYSLYKDKIENLKWASYNWDMTKPYVWGKDPDVIAFGHTSNWTNNYLNKDRFELIDGVLRNDTYKFVFIEDLVKENKNEE